MNLNKYTKAELISKLNKSTNQVNKNSIIIKLKSYLSQIWELILTLKNLLVKLTLITLLIKIFKRYRIFRRIWTVINTIVMSIFSLSLIDNFGFDFIKNFLFEFKSVFTNAIDYLSNTRFYEYLNNLFSNKDKFISNKDKIISKNEENISNKKEKSHNIPTNKGGVWTPSDSTEHRVHEWLKRREEKIHDESNEESTYSNYKTYLIIFGLVITSCFLWVYFDEIKDTGSNFKEWIQSFWGNGDPANNNDPNLPPENRISQRAELERLVKEKTKETNSKISDLLVEKEKIISPSLEDLNEKVQDSWNSSTSPNGSTSSSETIKPSSSKVKIDSPLEDSFIDTESTVNNSKVIEDKTYLLKLKDSWKKAIKPELRESIEYVEKHLPKSELDDASYVTKLLEEINRKNLDYLIDLSKNKDRIEPSKLIYLKDINKNVDKWIEEMRSEISKFE